MFTDFCNLFTHFLEITGVGVVDVEKVVTVTARLLLGDDNDDDDEEDGKDVGDVADDVDELEDDDDDDAAKVVRQVSRPEVSRTRCVVLSRSCQWY